MILKALKYTRYSGTIREWSIVGNAGGFAYFDNINLLVGKNASGKSRALNVIREIANLLSGCIILDNVGISSEKFELIFHEDNDKYEYFLDFQNKSIIAETLFLNGKNMLDRSKKELINPANNVIVKFDIPDSILAITQIDQNKEPYFSSFVLWGHQIKNYLFSNQIEKNRLVRDYTIIEQSDFDVEDTNVLVHTFYLGKTTFGESFVSEVKNCMHDLGYPQISNIDIQEKKGGYGICVEEYEQYLVSQQEMSQGMFRALSLFIMLTYARLSNISICILVDDMGEGLDFERSIGLIDIVINKIQDSNIQFFMTSNDRHIMNKIPLRYWTVIDRERSKSVFYDYTNSREVFDDFKYTGLNNFDFLTTDFYSKGFGNIDEEETED